MVEKLKLEILDLEGELMPEILKSFQNITPREKVLIDFAITRQFAKNLFVIQTNLLYVTDETAKLIGIDPNELNSWGSRVKARAKLLNKVRKSENIDKFLNLGNVVFTEMISDGKEKLKEKGLL